MNDHSLSLKLHKEKYDVCRFLPDRSVADLWELLGSYNGFVSVTKTDDEVSVVCLEGTIQNADSKESGWRLLQVKGPLDFGLVGVLHGILTVLKDAGISVFVVSTYDTDYVMVKEVHVEKALSALRKNRYLIDQH